MRKLTLLLCVVFAYILQMNAQQYVSTEPSNKNVILEEFTGRNCGYCPDGHRIANQIMRDNPGRVWAINVHAGGFAPTSYPNLICQDGQTIHNGFSVSGYPSGVVNRSTASAIGRGEWTSAATQQLNQPAVLNVAGMAVINPATRVATIDVEVYYTDNSAQTTNYLTVAMLQDSILGSQSGGTSNPEQMINGQYCHMHILRDVITSSAWGEEITPTTQGTLITRSYTYEIPEIIGDPNGVEVDLDNVFFLAWVSETQQGAATRPILSACEIETNIGSDEPIFPYITGVEQIAGVSCSHTKEVVMTMKNGGVEELTNVKFQIELDGEVTESEWNGSLQQFFSEQITLQIDVPFGTHSGVVRIVEANGVPYDLEQSFTVTCDEWMDLNVTGEEVTFTLDIMQDKFGNQTTWEVTGYNGTVYASGGPYTMLQGSTATELHREEFTVPANECMLLSIYDNVGNGICCAYGQGYYQLKDADGNVIIDGDGEFGSEASHLISINSDATMSVTTADATVLGPTEAIVGGSFAGGTPVEVGVMYRTADETTYHEAAAASVSTDFEIQLTGLTHSTEYLYKAFARTGNDQIVYGEEKSFTTEYDAIDENNGVNCNIYPNPSKGVVYVKGVDIAKVMVFNSLGQLVEVVESGNESSVNIENLSVGVYFVRVMNNEGNATTKKVSVVR